MSTATLTRATVPTPRPLLRLVPPPEPCPNPAWCTDHDSQYDPHLPAGACFSTAIRQGPVTAYLTGDDRGVTVSLGITETDETGCDGGLVDLTLPAAEDLIRVLTGLVRTAKGETAAAA